MFAYSRFMQIARRVFYARLTLRLLLAMLTIAVATRPVQAQRSLGIDLSAWQGSLNQRVWNRLHTIDNQDFAFIRSSRGGTTGFYNQSDPNNNNGLNTLSQRYDDPYFVQNITRATHAGIYAGPYHFSRPDIVTNTGADEADHFIEMAGAWMRPGYMLPVHDLEAGDGFRTDNQLAQFSLDFSDRIYEVMGIRPAIYLNGNYAHNVIGGASNQLKNDVVNTYPVMWNARPENGANVQTENPSDYLSWTYGAWDDPPNPSEPWSFWQYSWTGNLSAYNGNLDLNVANGGIEFVKDRLVPALWTTAGDGQWSTLTNWNSGQTPISPVTGPGQVPPVGGTSLPDVRLPSIDDTVILEREDADITVTLSSGDHEIRKLVARESLDITGGSLTINYVPDADSTPYSAHFAAPVTVDGGSLSVHTTYVDPQQTFFLGGTLTANTIELMPHSTAPARIELVGDVTFNPLANAAAKIMTGAGVGSGGVLDLGGQQRTLDVANGAAGVDLNVDVAIVNGGLTKTGDGTLELSGANSYAGDTVLEAGALSLTDSFLADAANLHVSSGALLDLDFVGTDVIDSLFIDGVSQPAGTWGAVGSGADFTSPFFFGSGLLEVTTFDSPIPGDFNGDGFVDASDMQEWQADFGQNDGSDADGDGDSDGNDFLLWQANYGAGTPPVAASQAVPEPSTLTLLAVAAIAARCRRLTRRD